MTAKTTTVLGKVSITPRGEYNKDTQYNRLDAISHKGSSFLILAPCMGIEPSGDNVVSMLLAAKGKDFEYSDYTPEQLKELKGDKGDTGKGLSLLAFFLTVDALKAAVTSPEAGDAYGVGSAAPYTVYIYDGINATWVDNGILQGAKGDPGDSVYKTWLKAGNTGTETEFLKAMEGKTPQKGVDYTDGKDGTSVTFAVVSDTPEEFKIKLIDADHEKTSPNLKGKDGRDYECPTLDAVPDETVLTYSSGDKTESFRIGQQARIFDAEKEEYVFYQLYDITEVGAAVWKKAGSGSDLVMSETLKITLTTNQSQPDPVLAGLVLHVKYGDNDTRLVWQGEPLTTTIPMNMTYRVELPEIEGYKTPLVEDFIALAGNTRDLSLSYNTTVLTVALSGNQSQPDSALNGTIITVTYDDQTRKITWQGEVQTIKVPTGQEITISGAPVTGYSKPSAIVRTPEGITDSVTLLYNATVMSISLTSNQPQPDANLNGTKVSVKYDAETKELTWQGSALAIKIPTGSAYTITAGTVNGYNAPEEKAGTASGVSGNISINYTTEKATINVTADDSASVAGQTLTVVNTKDNSQIYRGAAGTGIVLYIPFGTGYKVSVNAMSAYHPVPDQTFTAGSAARTVAVTYERIKTSRIVQDDSITDPQNISGDVNGTIIQQIRSKFRRCLAKKTADGQMTIRYLKNDNSNYYDDGSAAKLDGTEGDVMVYYPRFYYKYEDLGAGKFAYSFALVQLDSTWQESPESLLGAYEAYALSNKLYSRSAVASSGSISQTNFKAYARARGTGYQLIDYDQHKMIAWLFYAIYGSRNSQAICGSGTNSYTKETGQTNSIGNADTTTANGNSMSINFLGIENCWGNKYEFLDNVIVNPVSGNGVWRVTDTVKGTTRDIAGLAPNNTWNWPKKVAAGTFLDLVVTEAGMSETTGYCDGQYLNSSTSRVVLRSVDDSFTRCGVAAANASCDATSAYSNFSSRLAFKGEIREAVSVSAYKALPVNN